MPFHLPGQLYSGCCLFPTPHPWQLPAQARAGTVMLWPQWEGGKGEPGTVVLGEGCTATDRPHSPPPFGCKYLKPLEGLAQVVSSCSLQTPWACQSKPWSLPFPHCLPLKPSISATPECLHCPDRLLETGVCSGARSSVPWYFLPHQAHKAPKQLWANFCFCETNCKSTTPGRSPGGGHGDPR